MSMCSVILHPYTTPLVQVAHAVTSACSVARNTPDPGYLAARSGRASVEACSIAIARVWLPDVRDGASNTSLSGAQRDLAFATWTGQ